MSRGFCIKEIESEQVVDLNMIDKLICEEFGLIDLNPINDDFGHFLFPESKEPEYKYGQKSVSWVGLLHCITYYSSIRYGKHNKNEIIGALLEMLLSAITFPLSTINFISRFLDFLNKNGMYVFFEYMSDRKKIPGGENIFVKRNSREMYIKNETGVFLCDMNGTLLSYYPSVKVLMNKTEVSKYYTYGEVLYKPCIRTMKVPEGVLYINGFFFRGGLIKEDLELPNTLRVIDSGVFDNTSLVVLFYLIQLNSLMVLKIVG